MADSNSGSAGKPAFRADRYHVISDGGSVYFDDACPDGFETPEAAAEWARTQTIWPDLIHDLADGMSAIIALGADLNANAAAWEQWDDRGDWPDAPPVHNFARDLGPSRLHELDRESALQKTRRRGSPSALSKSRCFLASCCRSRAVVNWLLSSVASG